MKGLGKAVLGAMGLIVLGLMLLWAFNPSATVRLKRHFRLTDRDVESDASIEAALLRRLPLGSTKYEVVRFLEEAGIGKDGDSWFKDQSNHPTDPGIVCQIEYEMASPRLVKEHYHLGFGLDERKLLKSIFVKKMLTGL